MGDALDAGIAVRGFAGWARWFIGEPDRALVPIQEAVALARHLSEPHGLAHALAFAAVFHQLRRERSVAQHYADEAIALSAEHGLRVSVVGGGCSGFSYQLSFDRQRQEGDVEAEFDGLTVWIDPTSAQYLEGTQIDFVSSLHGGGFKFSNPKATGTCGCGSSFSA